MRYRNRFNVNLYDNPFKKSPELLDEKNRLESLWYDDEARTCFIQLDDSSSLMPMDREFEQWFADFYDIPSRRHDHDRNFSFFESFPQARPLRMLELGFGNGCLSRFFLRRGVDVHSIDLSFQYCRFLALSDRSSSPLEACAEMLPFKDRSFDVVTAFVALHHFNLTLSFHEISRVLKNGGLGIFMEPLSNSRLIYKLRQMIPVPDNESPGGGGLKTSETIAELRSLPLTYNLRAFELLSRFERLPVLAAFQDTLRRIDYFLLSILPFLRRYARTVVIVMRKP